VTWHRSLTHSLVLLPLWAMLLAGITRAFVNRRKWEAPSFAALTAIYAAGILSHILLDLVTTFGTLVWSPLAWSRPAWDLIFIVDFSLTGILLVPQLLAWAHRDATHARLRSILVWLLCIFATFAIGAIARMVGAPISAKAMALAILIFSVLCLMPVYRAWKLRPSPVTW